jgi:outer membrane protein assembly factor BamB
MTTVSGATTPSICSAGRALQLFTTAMIVACQPTAQRETAMFRGNAQRTGVVPAQMTATSAKVIWTTVTGGPVRSSPAVVGDLVIVGSGDGSLYALQREDGSVRWRFDAGSPIHSSPAVHQGRVYFGDRANRFYAVELTTGRLRWTAETGPDAPWQWGHEGWDYYTSSPLPLEDLVIVGSGDGNIYAFDAESGEERWRAATGGRVRASPALGDSVIFIGSTDGRLYALDLASGAQRWVYDTEGVEHNAAEFGFDRKSIQSTAAVDSTRLYFGSRDGGLYAVDRSTGRLFWRWTQGTSWIVGSPAVRNGLVCVGGSDGQYFMCVNAATGAELWRISTGARVFSSPAVSGDVLFVGTHAGDLMAVSRADGEVVWQLPLGAEVLSSPAVADGMIYVGTDLGQVHAIELTPDPPPHRAVYWDEDRLPWNLFVSHEAVRDYFARRGYTVANRETLETFLEQRILDREPSVAVFAMDDLPHAPGVKASDTLLLRRYLDAGGKVVWFGLPPLFLTRDSTGSIIGLDRETSAPSRLLGIDVRRWDDDRFAAYPTEAGRRWGLTSWWMGGSGVAVGEVSEVLAREETGGAGAWVRSYGGPAGSGFVHLWGSYRPIDLAHLEDAWRVAEYGIGRAAQPGI